MVRPRSLAVAAAVFLLLAPLVTGVAALLQMALGGVDYTSIWLGVALCAALGLLGGVAWRDARRGDDPSESVWSLIPSWQYTGRHAESGGLARDEQEAALADIEARADAREDRTD